MSVTAQIVLTDANVMHIVADQWDVEGSFVIFTQYDTPSNHSIAIFPVHRITEIRIKDNNDTT